MPLFRNFWVLIVLTFFQSFNPALAGPDTASPTGGASSSAYAGQSEWVFVQKQFFQGVHRLYWTANAVKINCVQQGYTIVAHGPEWKIFSYRDDDRVYHPMTWDEFYETYPYNPALAAVANKSYLKLGTKERDGLKITRFRANDEHHQIREVELVVAPEVAPQVSNLVLAYFRGPRASGVLYSLHVVSGDALAVPGYKDSETFHVSSIGKDIQVTTQVIRQPFNPADFECPKGYRWAKYSDIFSSKAQKKHMDVLIEDLDLGGKH